MHIDWLGWCHLYQSNFNVCGTVYTISTSYSTTPQSWLTIHVLMPSKTDNWLSMLCNQEPWLVTECGVFFYPHMHLVSSEQKRVTVESLYHGHPGGPYGVSWLRARCMSLFQRLFSILLYAAGTTGSVLIRDYYIWYNSSVGGMQKELGDYPEHNCTVNGRLRH